MKKSKKTLELDKLVISQLTHNHTIAGGNGMGVGVDQSEVTPHCKPLSKINSPCFETLLITCKASYNLDC